MRKVIKILGKVFSAAVLLLIILPLLLSLLLDIPAVQNFIVDKAARMASEKLETTVSIDHVDIGLFNKIKIKGFYVEDYQRDTLLYAGRVDAFITGIGLFGGGIVLSRGVVADAKFYLRETPEGEMNIKQITDRMSNKNKEKSGNFKLTLNVARIEGLDMCLERLDRHEPAFGIDFGHMHLYNIRALVNNLVIDGSTIYTDIDQLSARERSGFALENLSGHFYLTSGCLGFENTTIVTPQSNITIPHISLVGNSWAEYKDFIGEVQMVAAFEHSTISTDDIAYFAPKLQDWHLLFSNATIRAEGTVADFSGRISSLNVGQGTTLSAEVAVKGLPAMNEAHFDLTVSQLTSTAADIDVLARGVAQKRLPSGLLSILNNAGAMNLTARFQGELSSFDMQLGLKTGVGAATCNLQIQPLRGDLRRVQGDVQTRNLQLGALLGREKLFGRVSLAASVNGRVGRDMADANVLGRFSQLEFNGYNYDSLRFDGRIRNKEFDGSIASRDKNLRFDFFGKVDLNGKVPDYDFQMNLMHADLVKLHVNHRDSVSVLKGRMAARAGGSSLDDLNGRINITDATYHYNDKQFASGDISITGENSVNSKFVELKSNFIDLTFRSKTSYQEVIEYLKLSAWKYLPMLYDQNKFLGHDVLEQTSVADDYSLLSVNVKKINPLMDAISDGLQVADGSQLQLLFNPASDKLSMKVSSEYIERDKMLATRLNINAANRGDSLAVYASAEDLYLGLVHLPNLSVMGGAKQGRVQISAGFSDTLRKTSGMIGLQAAIAAQPGPNGRVLDLRILPSHITSGATTWQIFARNIELDTARVVINSFYVMNDRQELLINGIASRSREDSVLVRLQNFDLAPFSQFVDQMGYAIEGRTNGNATVKSALKTSEISADILLDSVRINNIPAPPLRLESRWDFRQNRAGVTVTNRIKQSTLVRGFYDPSQMRYYAKVNVDSLDVGLLDPVLSGVISGTKGVADIDLVLQGEHRNLDVAGHINVAGFSTTVDFTGVTYSMPKAVLEVKGNHFRASGVPVYDTQGNEGHFGIDLSLQHLSNIAYKIRVTPQQMLVLNTTQQDNDLFYGKVYATGIATISGDKAGVKMDITATTEDNSTFFMPLSSKSNISNADFVTFAKPVSKDTLNYLARKKLMFERKQREKSGPGGGMDINLALNVQPNLDFQLVIDPTSGNIIKGRGEGELNLHIAPRSGIFEMFGDYTITEGNYLFSLQNLINKKFIIEGGSSIQWTGDPVNALLNIDAVYKLKASLQPLLQTNTTDNGGGGDRSVPVECVIHLGGRLTNPAITFDVKVPSADPETQAVISNALSTPESVDTQFLYLLVFNGFLAEGGAGTGANFGVSASAATGLEFLTNQLSNWLSVDDYNVVIRYRPKSEVTSDELDFGLSKSLINNRLFIELEGNYVIDNKQAVNNSTMSNFMGEAYITYLIDRAGTLKLKAFTQTIDRFDENQGLQETGIGIYYKEDFNNFKDLKKRIKDRFTNKKRKAQRAAKVAEQQRNNKIDTLRESRIKQTEKHK